MTDSQTLGRPTTRDEGWRYADSAFLAASNLEALTHWDEHSVAADGTGTMLLSGESVAGGVLRYRVHIGKRGCFEAFAIISGSEYVRVEFEVTLDEGAHFELGGAILGTGEQTLEIVTDIRHAEPGGTSNQTVRSVLGGKATGSYLGKVAVARDAQKTDASQSVKAMLLDRTATANAKPELEIFADDVKCAHGATVGELDKSALFYMASRGIPPVEARRLMLQAFIADAFVKLDDEALREMMEAEALEVLEAIT